MLMPGSEPIPGYVLEKCLGQGMHGHVWQARSPGLTPIALKFIDLDRTSGWKMFHAVTRARMIRHPYIAGITSLWLKNAQGQLLDDDAFDQEVAVLSTVHEGQELIATSARPAQLIVATLLCDLNLADRLAECRAAGHCGIPPNDLLRYMEEAAKAIDFLNAPRHETAQGRCAFHHLAIKPSNILLRGGSVVLSDVGLARVSCDGVAATST